MTTWLLIDILLIEIIVFLGLIHQSFKIKEFLFNNLDILAAKTSFLFYLFYQSLKA